MSEKGGTGFPTLMFLDAEGRRLMRHMGPRTTKGFEGSLEEVQEFQALMAKAEAGDAKAATELLIRQLQLEWFDFEEAQERAAALEKVSKKQQEEITQLLIDTEVRVLAKAAGKDPAERRKAGEHFFAMWEADRVPATEAQLYPYWFMMADFAEDKGDKKLFKKIVGEADDALKRNSRYRRVLKGLEMRLANFPRK